MSASDPGSLDVTSSKLPTPMRSDGMTDGAGGGAGSTYPFRMIISTPRASDMKAGGHGDTDRMGTVRHMLATPRKTDADRGFRGDIRAQLDGQNSRHAGMLPTPVAQSQQGGMRWEGGAGGRKVLKESGLMDVMQGKNLETLPTPTKRDKRMDAWSPAYDKRKSPTMDAVMDGALTDRASDKWVYARQIAAVLTEAGLSGASETLPTVYGWMMGYPAGWLERALLSAVHAGLLPPPSSSKRTATLSSRKSPKQ
jgi:hypothetical protein